MMIEKKIKLKNSMSLNVRYTGERNKPTVLFIHFSEGTNEVFNGIIPNFQDSFRIVAPDLRGHGKSDKPKTGYHIDNMAEDIFYLLEELNVESCHIVGSSLGAEVAVNFASSYPDKVRSLVCEGGLYNEFGPYGLFDGSEEEITNEKKRRNDKFAKKVQPTFASRSEVVEKQIDKFKKDGIWNDNFKDFVESNVGKNDEGKYIYATPLYVSVDYNSHYWNFEFEQYYKKIECPILFIFSEDEWNNDKIKECFEGFTAFIKDFEVVYVQGSKHAFLWMQFAETMGQLANKFILKHQK